MSEGSEDADKIMHPLAHRDFANRADPDQAAIVRTA